MPFVSTLPAAGQSAHQARWSQGASLCNIRKVAMSRSMRIRGPSRIEGSLSVPGDKSISHRIVMLASVASGPSTVTGLASSADCRSTLDCIRKLGIQIDGRGPELVIHGRGLFGYCPPSTPVELNAGNSGSTIRMLSGLLAGQDFVSRIGGDASLNRRPMARIVEPLNLMGARIENADRNFPPLTIHHGSGAPGRADRDARALDSRRRALARIPARQDRADAAVRRSDFPAPHHAR